MTGVTDDQIRTLICNELDSTDDTFIRFCRQVIALDRQARAPQFDAISHKQEVLARQFCAEIAGPKGQPGLPPDPARLLEMAEALYEAEREEAAEASPSSTYQSGWGAMRDAALVEMAGLSMGYDVVSYIDQMYPGVWKHVPSTARISVRNLIDIKVSDLAKRIGGMAP